MSRLMATRISLPILSETERATTVNTHGFGLGEVLLVACGIWPVKGATWTLMVGSAWPAQVPVPLEVPSVVATSKRAHAGV